VYSTCSPLMKLESPGVAMIDLAQHLADDHLDVLVVDLHTLEAVDLLDLVDDVLRQIRNTLETQDVVRAQRTLGDDLALLDRSPSNTDRWRHLGISDS
jgi:hypothetical protein